MSKKLIMGLIVSVVLTTSIFIGFISYVKSKVGQYTDKELSFSRLTLLEGFRLALSFKERKDLLPAEYFYSMPSGIVYKQIPMTSILLRVDEKKAIKVSNN